MTETHVCFSVVSFSGSGRLECHRRKGYYEVAMLGRGGKPVRPPPPRLLLALGVVAMLELVRRGVVGLVAVRVVVVVLPRHLLVAVGHGLAMLNLFSVRLT